MELKIDNAAIAEMVKESIKVAAAAALSQQSDSLIKHIVDMAMNAKPQGSYGRETIFEVAIQKAIHDECTAALSEWVATNRPQIRKLVHDKLMKQKGMADMIADKLIVGLGKDLHVSAYLRAGSD
jgi:hypothetical protein